MRAFGSWLCLGLREGCGAMASAKSVGENLSTVAVRWAGYRIPSFIFCFLSHVA